MAARTRKAGVGPLAEGGRRRHALGAVGGARHGAVHVVRAARARRTPRPRTRCRRRADATRSTAAGAAALEAGERAWRWRRPRSATRTCSCSGGWLPAAARAAASRRCGHARRPSCPPHRAPRASRPRPRPARRRAGSGRGTASSPGRRCSPDSPRSRRACAIMSNHWNQVPSSPIGCRPMRRYCSATHMDARISSIVPPSRPRIAGDAISATSRRRSASRMAASAAGTSALRVAAREAREADCAPRGAPTRDAVRTAPSTRTTPRAVVDRVRMSGRDAGGSARGLHAGSAIWSVGIVPASVPARVAARGAGGASALRPTRRGRRACPAPSCARPLRV